MGSYVQEGGCVDGEGGVEDDAAVIGEWVRRGDCGGLVGREGGGGGLYSVFKMFATARGDVIKNCCLV